MNLGGFEAPLIEALRERLPGSAQVLAGPAFAGPASGVRPEVFVHAARLSDRGGVTAEGAVIVRLPWEAGDGATGFAEDRPAGVEIDVTFVCAQLWQAQTLAGLAAMPLLECLETLAGVDLATPPDARSSLRFTEHRATFGASRTERHVHDGVAVYRLVLTLRLDGFVQVRLAAPGGLQRDSAHARLAPTIEVCFNPEGTDLQREHVLLRNGTGSAIDLAGWTIEDAARRPHRYRFPPLTLMAPGGSLRLWSARGTDDTHNLYWGRRQAVWTNTGDTAVLRDPDGIERARAECVPASPPAAKPRPPGA
ncbi:MAG: lamin tail domain-containing protein [Piscinibacter sp.]|nr:lamin tail domain-containing protein [Piscinibacter sp.]